MQEQKGRNNAMSLFLVKKIPSDNWIRKLLDLVSPTEVFPIFSYIFNALYETEHLSRFKSINGNLLIPLDGTQYHSSNTIHCEQCSTKNHKNGTITYSHSAITPVIGSKNSNHVISLEPEFITPQDGSKKQDSPCLSEFVSLVHLPSLPACLTFRKVRQIQWDAGLCFFF